MVLAVLLAFAAAMSFAIGSALQHRVAGAEPAEEESRRGFLGRITRRPSWLVGLALSAVAFTLHAAALSQGDLALVQPVIVSGIVFAVLIRSGLAHHLPPGRTVLWLVLTAGGLGLFLALRPEGVDRPAHLGRAAAVIVVGVALAAGAALLARASRIDHRRGVLLAFASGTLFGLVAGCVKLIFTRLGSGIGAVLAFWPLWVLVVVGLSAVLLNQRAYQVAQLSVTAPVLNVAQVLVALAFGVIVFEESSNSSTAQTIGQLIALAVVIIGVVQLTRADAAADEESPTAAAAAQGRGSAAD